MGLGFVGYSRRVRDEEADRFLVSLEQARRGVDGVRRE